MVRSKDEFPLNWHSKATRRAVIIVIVGLVALYGVIPTLHTLGFKLVEHLPLHWIDVFVALGCFLFTFLLSSSSYKLLAFYKLRFIKIVLVQTASFTLNLLLPAGLGNISINYLFLRTNRHKSVQAGLVVAASNFIGIVGNSSIIVGLLLLFGIDRDETRLFSLPSEWLIIGGAIIAALLIVVGLILAEKHKTLFKTTIRQLVADLRNYKHRPQSLFGAYLCAAFQAGFTALAFWFCIRSFGLHLSYPVTFIIYAAGIVVGAITPTPGGLGGIEASLTAGLVAVHAASAAVALSVVLTYRVITYWIPILLGMGGLFLVIKLKVINWHH